jgi:hypothetical protein
MGLLRTAVRPKTEEAVPISPPDLPVLPVAKRRRIGRFAAPGEPVLLTTLSDPQFRLLRPIELEVEKGEGGESIVSNQHLGACGAGRTLQEAIDDYQSMLLDLYWELTDSEAILSRHLRERLDYLRTLIAPR